MVFNPRGSFSLDLSLFGSWVQDIQATDLPPGASPDNSDVFFLPGGIYTRPALKRVLPSPLINTPSVVSVKDFPLPSGDSVTMFLDSTGTMWSNLADTPTDTTNLLTVTAGVQFKAETAFGKQWYAFFSAAESADLSDNPFVGVEVPVYYNGTQIYRVTSDAPGASPTFSSVAMPIVPLVQSAVSGSLTVTEAYTSGAARDALGNLYYPQITYICSTAPPSNWLGQIVNVSGLSGTNSSFLNITGEIAFVGPTYFVINAANYTNIVLQSQSGTAAVAGNYLTRLKNVVTAYIGASPSPNMMPGFWTSVINSNGTQINGPNWTITEISRDVTGLVTVTISTQLANLPAGASLYIAASDSSDFPAGYQTVFQVVSASGGTTVFTYLSLNTSIASSGSGGSVYQTWSPSGGANGNAAQIIATGLDPVSGYYIQYFQLGPDSALSSTGGTPQAQVIAQAAAGLRNAVVIFTSVDGAQTAPSIPVNVTTLGGGNLILAQNIPIGPPGTASRAIAFTPAEGANYYYIAAAIIPQVGVQSSVIATGTVINDNVTTSAVLDFSDTQLAASTQIDIAGNNLFNQIVLAPCLGNIEYQGRMAWFGEINNIKNFVNMGFDGGFNPPSGTCSTTGSGYDTIDWVSGAPFNSQWVGSTMFVGGQQVTIASVTSTTSLMVIGAALEAGTYNFQVINPNGALPLGWDASEGDRMGSLIGWPGIVEIPGFAYQLAPLSNSMIQQSVYRDYYGAPILQGSTQYNIRYKVMRQTGSTAGQLIFDLYSPSSGGIIMRLAHEIFITNLPTSFVWAMAEFAQPTLAAIPSDTVLRIYVDGNTNVDLYIDEVELIPANQPVSFDQVRISYYQNPFGFDEVSGVLSVDPSQSIAGAFRQRGYLYFIGGDGGQSLFQSQNNGTGEPDTWDVTEYVGVCGCSGPNAVDFGEEFAIWAGRYGVREFVGNPSATKISQEWDETFQQINWQAQTTIWVKNDPVNRLLYFGLPLASASTPSILIHMSYRLNDVAYNVPDPVHISQYSGKMIVTDLSRRWSPWQLPMNCADMCTRPLLSGLPGVAKAIVFGGGFGNLYNLDTWNYFPLNPSLGVWNCTDDDYGGINSYYTTYFWFNHDIEQQPQLGQFRKIFNFVAIHAIGVGSLQVTPYIDALTNPAPSFPMPPLSLTDPGYDLEFHPITQGNRVAYKLAPYIGSPGVGKAMGITHMIVSAKKAPIFPIRGTIVGG